VSSHLFSIILDRVWHSSASLWSPRDKRDALDCSITIPISLSDRGMRCISQWVHIRFLSYCIGSNTILVPLYGCEETRGTCFIVPSQLSYLCQTGLWGAYVISQWVHIRFPSHCIGSNTTIVPLYGREETRGMCLNILWQLPYLCQKGVWGGHVISWWVPIHCGWSYIQSDTILVPLWCPKKTKGVHSLVM
jgi:hypothetical protein